MLHQHSTQGLYQEHGQLSFSFARNPLEVAEAQRLRYKIFADKMGASLPGKDGIDQDGFDVFCDHLLVRDNKTGKVVGTYRLLDPHMADEAGGYYSAGEFDLSRLMHLFDRTVEVGRACVHADYRTGGTLALLWAGLAKYMQTHRYDYMMGCGSISMADGGHMAASLYNQLQHDYLSPPEYRVFPRCPLPMDALTSNMQVRCPPLIKGYLRLGAYIYGEPAWDPHFNTADILIMLPLSRMDKRYAAHFFK
jgi:putative hemolysin